MNAPRDNFAADRTTRGKKILCYFNMSSLLSVLLFIAYSTQAGKLSIVMDDFGYRPDNENQILQLPIAISIAILPNAPYAREMAIKAHNQGREILIHLPMAPFSKQRLEPDTLKPDMDLEEIQRIIRNALANVPYAVGINNHMGSAMTASLSAMQKVMRILDQYPLYFLDSRTTSNSQVSHAAIGTSVKVLKRQVFLDDVINQAAIRQQFNHALQLANRHGSVIAIGHPHPTTIHVLQKMLPTLPSDIVLVPPSMLLTQPLLHETKAVTTVKRARNRMKNIRQCKIKPQQPSEKIYADRMFIVLAESLRQNPAIIFVKKRWQQYRSRNIQ